MMPEMDGFEFMRELRGKKNGKRPGDRDHGQGTDGGGSPAVEQAGGRIKGRHRLEELVEKYGGRWRGRPPMRNCVCRWRRSAKEL